MSQSPTTLKVAARAEEARVAAGVSKTALATALNVSRSTITRRLKGEKAWSSDDIAAASALLGVSPNHLLGIDEGVAA